MGSVERSPAIVRFYMDSQATPEWAEFFRIVTLTGCANAYAAIAPARPKSVCKLTKINLRYIRDSISNGILCS